MGKIEYVLVSGAGVSDGWGFPDLRSAKAEAARRMARGITTTVERATPAEADAAANADAELADGEAFEERAEFELAAANRYESEDF